MEVLSEKNRILYDKLVRLADGDGRIVVKVLSNPSRNSVTLESVIKEIEKLRKLKAENQSLCEEFILHGTENFPPRHRPEASAVYAALSNPDSTVADLKTAIMEMLGLREKQSVRKPREP